jgi:hypothetical protein
MESSGKPLLLVGRVTPRSPVIVEFEQMIRHRDLGIDLFRDAASHLAQRDHFTIRSDVFFVIRYDGLSEPHGVTQWGYPSGRIESGAVVQIQEEIALLHEAFYNFHEANVAIHFLESAVELAVHVALDASIVLHYGQEIGPWNYDEIAFFEGEVSV